MRTKEELDTAFEQVGALLNQEEHEDDESLQGIYETLKWVSGYDWENTVGPYLLS